MFRQPSVGESESGRTEFHFATAHNGDHGFSDISRVEPGGGARHAASGVVIENPVPNYVGHSLAVHARHNIDSTRSPSSTMSPNARLCRSRRGQRGRPALPFARFMARPGSSAERLTPTPRSTRTTAASPRGSPDTCSAAASRGCSSRGSHRLLRGVLGHRWHPGRIRGRGHRGCLPRHRLRRVTGHGLGADCCRPCRAGEFAGHQSRSAAGIQSEPVDPEPRRVRLFPVGVGERAATQRIVIPRRAPRRSGSAAPGSAPSSRASHAPGSGRSR